MHFTKQLTQKIYLFPGYINDDYVLPPLSKYFIIYKMLIYKVLHEDNCTVVLSLHG